MKKSKTRCLFQSIGLLDSKVLTKLQEGPTICLGCTENSAFSSAASCKKGTIFGASQKNIQPSYFIRALSCSDCFFLSKSVNSKVFQKCILFYLSFHCPYYWENNGFQWWWTSQVFSKVMINHETEMQWSQYGYQLYSKACSKQLLKLFDAFSHGKVCLIFEDFFGYGLLLWLHPLWCMKGDLYLDQDQSTIEPI